MLNTNVNSREPSSRYCLVASWLRVTWVAFWSAHRVTGRRGWGRIAFKSAGGISLGWLCDGLQRGGRGDGVCGFYGGGRVKSPGFSGLSLIRTRRNCGIWSPGFFG